MQNLSNLEALKPEKEENEDQEVGITDLDAQLIEFAPEEESKGDINLFPKKQQNSPFHKKPHTFSGDSSNLASVPKRFDSFQASIQ